MNALIVGHEISAPFEVLSQGIGDRAAAANNRAASITVVDCAESFEEANAALVEIHSLLKEIESVRKSKKAPVNQLGKAIDSICSSVTDPIDAVKRSLLGQVAAWQRKESERVAAERRAAEEIQRKAEAEARAEQERLRAEAQAVADAEAAELEAVLGEKVEPAAVVAPIVAAVVAPATRAAISASAPVAAAVSARKVKVLVIDDEGIVPCVVGGITLRQLDRAAIKRAIDAGLHVPGCRIEEQEQLAMRAQR